VERDIEREVFDIERFQAQCTNLPIIRVTPFRDHTRPLPTDAGPGVLAEDGQHAAAALALYIERTDGARTERRRATPPVLAACTRWMQTYQAAKCALEAMLRLTGRLDLLPQIFHDLAVTASAKGTRAPDEAAPLAADQAPPN
jgi:hypothetical protein